MGRRDGPPIVLLAGEFAAVWMRVIPDLVATHRVIAADLPGLGASEGSGDVLRWLDELVEQTCAEPPVLVGKGLGGALAARYAVAHSDRIAHLVLVDAQGLERFRPPPGMALTFLGVLMRPTERGLERSFRRYCFVDLDRVRAEMGERYDWMVAYALDRFRTSSVKAAMRSLTKRLAPAIPEAELDRIAVPTTLIWGRHDVAAPLRIAQTATTARLVAACDRGRSRRPGRRAAGRVPGRAAACARSLLPNRMTAERIETVIVGGGQAGLSTGFHLARRGLPFVILEANERIGDSWRRRWDSLRLFTPARYNELPAVPFPRRPGRFPARTTSPTTWRTTRSSSISRFGPVCA